MTFTWKHGGDRNSKGNQSLTGLIARRHQNATEALGLESAEDRGSYQPGVPWDIDSRVACNLMHREGSSGIDVGSRPLPGTGRISQFWAADTQINRS